MSTRPRSSSLRGSSSSRAGRRVLVVDDDPLVRDLLSAVLMDRRFVLDVAPDGETALELARRHPPDVVILDVMMPGRNGYEVCRTLRADPHTAGAQILMLTARNTNEDRDEGLKAGADAFFTKPFSPLDLIDRVNEGHHGAA